MMISNLHFLRPEWFFAFAPLILFLIAMFRRHSSSMSWKAVCDEELLPHVLIQSGNKTSRLPLWLVFIATSLSIVAAAGPVWKKLPQPVFREQSALVILMDLSKSMDATDLKPSRLERAKLKTLDILDSRKGGQTALIVYAADAFVVTPLTDDTETIANLVPTLDTELMPAQGSNTGSAMGKAVDLLTQAGVSKGEILLITDGVDENSTKNISHITSAGHRLSILGVGTLDGGPIAMNGGFLQDANGAIVIPKLQPQQLRKTAQSGDGLYVSLQTGDADTNRLVDFFSSRRVSTEAEESQLTADTWQEEGPWLLLLVLPFAALWPRRGWLLVVPVFSSTLLSTVLLALPEPAYAVDTENLWSSPDQKAMQAFNKGDAKRAAELFEQESWKSSAYYRAGDYEKSVSALEQPASSDDFYNKGNALAKLGRYPEAVAAYDEALKLDENNEDASFNRELVKKKLEQQNQQQDGDSEDKDNKGNDNKDDKQQDSQSADNRDGQDQNQSENNTDQQSSQNDKQPNEQGQSENEKQTAGEEGQDENKMENAAAEEKEENSDEASEKNQAIAANDNEMSEDEQATEQWLKRIPDDPGGLLRRKFLYQYKRMPHKADRQPW